MTRSPPRRPLLLLDVDGVLNPFPDTQAGYSEYDFFPDDDEPVRLCPDHADRLRACRGGRAVAWIEDVVADEARAWAAARCAPTLIVEVASASGLTRETVERLKSWAHGLDTAATTRHKGS